MTTIGYARVSTQDQNAELQLRALREAGCDKIFTDKISGAAKDRPQLGRALAYLRPGDVLCVWKLDRLGRSLRHLLEIVERFRETGVGFRSLTETIDTTSHTGRLIFQIFGAVAEYERSLIKERVSAGVKAARANGKPWGRRPRFTGFERAAIVKYAREHSYEKAAKHFGIGAATVFRYVLQSTLVQVHVPE